MYCKESPIRLPAGWVVVMLAALLLPGCDEEGTAADAAVDAGTDAPADGPPDAAVADTGGGDGGGGVVTITCQNPPMTPPATGTCAVTAGTGAGVLIRGTLLAPDKVYQNGHLLLDGAGKIACVGCDCSGEAGYKDATVVACAKGVVSPGLINPHDHINFCLDKPKTNSTRYDHRHEWRKGKYGKPKISVQFNSPMGDGARWGELRMILGGATSIVSTGGADKLLRNLDGDNEGLGKKSIVYGTFPLGDSGGTTYDSGCGGYSKLPKASTVNGSTAYVTHVAEGVNAAAHNEILCLNGKQSGGVDITLPKAGLIHSIALNAMDAVDLAQGGTAVIWTPRGNISLYGVTADVVMLDRVGVRLAIGTDWNPSGSMNMLRELACADFLNKTRYGGYFSDHRLWAMATHEAAAATGMDDVIGKLAPGLFADIAIFDGSKHPAHRAVLAASVPSVVLVLRGGDVLYGDEALVKALAASGAKGCEAVEVCSRKKSICLERETGKTLAALTASVGSGAYPLYFCGTPTDEPTCIPSRPGEYDGTITSDDDDGDGVKDSADSCPKLFNPPRPMNGGVQPDVDGDKVGDECDVCPLDANTTNCTSTPNPNDKDGDGIENGKDNCPQVYNKDQKDSDKDGIGDACDPCPKPNPGGGTCPYTIKELRDSSLGMQPKSGTPVKLSKVTVIAIRTTKSYNYGFYVREGKGDHEAIFVYTSNDKPADSGNTPLKVGDQVDLTGTYELYNKIDEISSPTGIKVVGTTTVDAVDTTTAKLQPGSTTAEALESHLVRVKAVTVAATTSADAFWVTDSGASCTGTAPACAKVGDFFYDGGTNNGKPAAKVGDKFSSITGVINGYKDSHTLDVRTDSDLAK